jgi:hypothetical protein
VMEPEAVRPTSLAETKNVTRVTSACQDCDKERGNPLPTPAVSTPGRTHEARPARLTRHASRRQDSRRGEESGHTPSRRGCFSSGSGINITAQTAMQAQQDTLMQIVDTDPYQRQAPQDRLSFGFCRAVRAAQGTVSLASLVSL